MEKKEAKKEAEIKKTNKEVKSSTIVLAVIVAIAAYLVLAGILTYFFGINNNLIRKTTSLLPYPAAMAGNGFVSIKNLDKNTQAVKKFYENQDFSDLGLRVDFSTLDGKKRFQIKEKNVLNKLIENSIIEKEAKKVGIKITPDVVSQEVNRKMNEYGSRENVKEDLARLYGWDISDFEENIVKPDLYKEKLAENIVKNDQDIAAAKEKISKALEELKKGTNFEVVVGKYSEGESAKNRGDLGWFSADQMLPEIASVAFSLKKGEQSEIVESSIGFHIIIIDDKRTEDDVDKVKLRQIFVRSKNFGDWLCEKEKEYRILIPFRNYQWNRDSCQVEFRSGELRQFEENLEKNSPDDISVMF